ncbi:BQ2448_2761 [Microbotryum intermedium]|uniref:BQ2448_2761 protein n=1 Tax=Microbotryum intermedium TaxID=269621 RepID=A0A238FGP6_9BASI|nr:BQ2448_2761 [Microbotryum intermedium]
MINRRFSTIVKPRLFRSVIVGRSDRNFERDFGALVEQTHLLRSKRDLVSPGK